MHYETAAECYVEMRLNGHFKEDAIDLLAEEASCSQALTEADRESLLQTLEFIRQKHCFGDSEAVENVLSVLSRTESFKVAFAKVITDMLSGKR